jgi:hypothetical protein
MPVGLRQIDNPNTQFSQSADSVPVSESLRIGQKFEISEWKINIYKRLDG